MRSLCQAFYHSEHGQPTRATKKHKAIAMYSIDKLWLSCRLVPNFQGKSVPHLGSLALGAGGFLCPDPESGADHCDTDTLYTLTNIGRSIPIKAEDFLNANFYAVTTIVYSFYAVTTIQHK